MRQSLLERAGLEIKAKSSAREHNVELDGPRRFDVMDDSEGQIKDPNRPV